MSSPAESSSSVERTSHRPTKVFIGHTSFVESVAYFPDGRRIASGSWDKTIRIWNVDTGQQEGEALEHDSSVQAIAIAPDGGKIAGKVDGGLIVWDVKRRKRAREVKIDGDPAQGVFALNTGFVAFSPDGGWIATASSASTSIQLWDVDAGSPVRELQEHVDTVRCLSYSPKSTRIAIGSADGSFRVLDTSTGGAVIGPIQGHAGVVQSLVYSRDGRLLVTASNDRSIRVWDTATGREVGRPMLLPGDQYRCVAISADGKMIASISFDNTVRLWNLETRRQVGDPFAGQASDLTRTVAFSPNGRFVISGRIQDINLWDTAAVLDTAASPPATSNRESSRSIVPSAHVTAHPNPPLLQQKRAPSGSKADRDTSSLSSSILDLPAAAQPQPERVTEVDRAPSIDDWDSFQSHRQPTAEPTETQQEPRAEPQNLNTPPSASDNQWTHIIRGRLRHWWSPKPSAHVETPQVSPHSPPEESPTPSKPLDPEPETGLSILPTQVNPDTPKSPDARPGPKWTLSLFWARLRGTKPRPIESLKTEPPGPQHSPAPPTKGANVAAGRAFTRLMAAPDRLEELVTPPPRVQADDMPPSPSSVGTYEIAEDLRNYRPPWLYRFCYALCYPRDTHYVTS